MTPWSFVIGAYALTGIASAAIAILSWSAMRRAEAAAETMKR